LVRHRSRSPCRPLSRGMPIPSDLSDFPSRNSCGNGTYVFEVSWMCVSRLENCNISGVECGKKVFEKPSRISVAFSDYFLVTRKTFQSESLLSSRSESKAWNKQYRFAVCDVKYAYCDTTLQGDLQKKPKKNTFFLKIKYDPLIHFIHIKITANTLKYNSKSINLKNL
jgi:hypothetical protein